MENMYPVAARALNTQVEYVRLANVLRWCIKANPIPTDSPDNRFNFILNGPVNSVMDDVDLHFFFWRSLGE